MSLATRYRPTTFDEMIGNKKIISSIKSLLQSEEQPQAWLFYGGYGRGKTTLARIVARGLGCDHPVDLEEVDAAKYSGVGHSRQILSRIHLKPAKSRRRVWIFDECHAMSKEAERSLLKSLEEAPKSTAFILATTDVDGLLPTVKSRCMQFQVEDPPEEELIRHLRDVARRERVKLPKEVAEQITRGSQGSVRDAMMMLEQVLGLPLEEMLGAVERMTTVDVQTKDLLRALMGKSDWKKIAGFLDGLRGEDPEKLRRAVIGYCTAVLMKGPNSRAFLVADTMIGAGFIRAGFSEFVITCYRAWLDSQDVK